MEDDKLNRERGGGEIERQKYKYKNIERER